MPSSHLASRHSPRLSTNQCLAAHEVIVAYFDQQGLSSTIRIEQLPTLAPANKPTVLLGSNAEVNRLKFKRNHLLKQHPQPRTDIVQVQIDAITCRIATLTSPHFS